ncbi:MAG: hypothetical protein HYX34_13600 [Actinobacteria bacterium]|nr:hypothetical protein [Actinomycetota bacterium]
MTQRAGGGGDGSDAGRDAPDPPPGSPSATAPDPPPGSPSATAPDPNEPDWLVEDGLWIATRSGLLRRGRCCGSGCRNCPWVGTEDVHPDRPS